MHTQPQPRPVNLSTKLSLLSKHGELLFMGLITSLIFIFISMPNTLLLASNAISPHTYETIDKKGTHATAIIIDFQSHSNIRVEGEPLRKISYQYYAEQPKKSIQTTFSSFSSKMDELQSKESTQIPIKYFNKKAIVIGIEPYTMNWYEYIWLFLPYLMPVAFFYYVFIKFQRDMQLLQFGIVTEAHITKIKKTSKIGNSPSKWGLFFYYKYHIDGEEYSGKEFVKTSKRQTDKKVGDSLAIFVSPTQSKYSCLIRENEVTKNNW